MDVSFTNVLEGARQYFQGLPAPSTSGSPDLKTASTPTPTPTPTTPTPTQPPPASTETNRNATTSPYDYEKSTSSKIPCSSSMLVPQSSCENVPRNRDDNQSRSYWNPSPDPGELRTVVEPYAPQPTRVEVPDTRQSHENTSEDTNLATTTHLIEMQSSRQRQNNSSMSIVTIPEFVNDSIPNHSPQLHQMQTVTKQPSSSPAPVYQQLNNVAKSSSTYTATEIINPHSNYQTPENRSPAVPIVAQRTQYYPRYHHPDITKSAPVPFSHGSVYQSSAPPSATSPSASNHHHATLRPSPVEPNNSPTLQRQNNVINTSNIVNNAPLNHQRQQLPQRPVTTTTTSSTSYPCSSPVANHVELTNVYTIPDSTPNSGNYRVSSHLQQQQQQQQQQCRTSISSTNAQNHHHHHPPQLHHSDVTTSHSSPIVPTTASSASSSSSSSSNPCNIRYPNQSSHIPPSHNHPAHIPSSHQPPLPSIPSSPSALSSTTTPQTMTHHPPQLSQQSFQHHHHSNRIPASIGTSHVVINSNPYPVKPGNPYSTAVPTCHSSMTSPQHMLPPSSSSSPSNAACHPPAASSQDQNHHASPTPPRQSPHLSTMHHPHVVSPHLTASPHRHTTPSPHNSAPYQPQSPTYPPTTPQRSQITHPYNLPTSSQQYRQGTNYPSPYQTVQQPPPHHPPSSYHSFQKTPQQTAYYSQSPNRTQYGHMPTGPPATSQNSQICSPIGSTVNDPTVINGTSYQTQETKSPLHNVAPDAKRTSVSTINQTAGYGAYRMGQAAPSRSGNTHNLPPIASVSSYHSNKNAREAIGKAQSNQRQRLQSNVGNLGSSVSSASSMGPYPPRVAEYPAGPSPINHPAIPCAERIATSGHPTSVRYGGQQQAYPTYATTVAPSHHANNPPSNTTVTSISSALRISAPTNANTIRSSASSDSNDRTHSNQRSNENYVYKDYTYGNSISGNQNNSARSSMTMLTTVQPVSQTNGTITKKRESPLDLSVKTVKTPADSTARDDLDSCGTDKHVTSTNLNCQRNNGARQMLLPNVQTPSGNSFASYDSRNVNGMNRNTGGSCLSLASTPQTVCAPKVDFLPDFNSTPMRNNLPSGLSSSQENSLRRQTSRQSYDTQQLQHQQNANVLPRISTFKNKTVPEISGYENSKNAGTSYGTMMTTPTVPRSSTLKYPTMIDQTRQAATAVMSTQDYQTNSIDSVVDGRGKFPQSSMTRDHQILKRPAEPGIPGNAGCAIPNKQPRLDSWRLAIDKQIQQKLSTAKALHEQQKRQEMKLPVPLPNGTLINPAGYDHRNDVNDGGRYQTFCDKRNYGDGIVPVSPTSYNHHPVGKSCGVHPFSQELDGQACYPGYKQSQRSSYALGAAAQPPETQSNTGADKRVLSLLRNSLENKQQREEQMNSSQQPMLVNHSQQSFQNKVVAPVEPKANIGRHNLSPFTAASLLERNSNTPPHYKFHVPRAVDSITQETPRSLYGSRVNSSATLPGKEALLGPRVVDNQIRRDKDDGLAAILAAKIRTKAELKQVCPGQFVTKPTTVPSQDVSATPTDLEGSASTSTPQSAGSSAGSPPKLTREKTACLPPRRRLFSRTEEESLPVAATIPTPAPIVATEAFPMPARASGFRSSSETSVFDFRESDSEGEMPVLERQTLEEMRRDRKQLSKVQPPVPLNDAMCMGVTSSLDLVKIELKENEKTTEPDPFWTATCDKFMEQLRTGDSVKKRGRKKKITETTKPDDPNDDDEITDQNSSITSIKCKIENIKQEIIDPDQSTDPNDLPESPKPTPKPSEPLPKITPQLPTVERIKTEPPESTPDPTPNKNNSIDDPDELPLIIRAAKKKSKKDSSDPDDEMISRKRRVRRGSRIKLESSSPSSDSSSDENDDDEEEEENENNDDSSNFVRGNSSVAQRLRTRKRSATKITTDHEGMKLRSRDTTPQKIKSEKDKETKKTISAKGGSGSAGGGGGNNVHQRKSQPKPLFGDGSDFRPGWEDEVYVYKKSLRMPPRLITVSKPSRFHRLSTSLPDLDPGSPALSVSMDSSDVCLVRKRNVDSDAESNYSFSVTGLGPGSKIDDEEATSSTTISCPAKTTPSRVNKSESNSIVDLLARKVGTGKKELRKKLREKEKMEKSGSKTLPKASNEPELLPTPSLSPLIVGEVGNKAKGKTPVKNNKSEPINVTDSYLLGYFRKETVNNFRNTFRNNHALPNEFSTFVLKSRTRTETRVLKKQATIREVFGEERPASAPPMQNHAGDTSQDDDSQNETRDNSMIGRTKKLRQKVASRLRNSGILRSHETSTNVKRDVLEVKKRRKDLVKCLAEKKILTTSVKNEIEDDGNVDEDEEEEINDVEEDEEEEEEPEINEPEVDKIDYAEIPSKKKFKLRTGRRKFRSGFDYIRKKKKPMKKEDGIVKERKKPTITRPNAESVADIQSEIRTWVIKKGVGETILHRAARLGYTDVTAYCLEKLNSPPSPKDNAGYTPLHEACSRGHLEIAKLLLAYGANASESANGGIRPLHEAAENGATELVRLLLSYGADPLLATYSGQTPLMLAVDTDAYSILEQHLSDVQGRTNTPWCFAGPSSIFDLEETGYNSLEDPPAGVPEPELEEIEMEMSDVNLPVLFTLTNDPDKWVLLQDLMTALKVKSRDALLRQVNPKAPTGPAAVAHREVMRDLKLHDFLEQSRCCHLLSGGERINVRGSKVTLIKYNDKVRSLLNVERVVINLR